MTTTAAPALDEPRVDTDAVAQVAVDLLDLIAPDWTSNPHMADTPRRWAAWWAEFLGGDATARLDTTFPVVHIDQLVVVSGIEVWSLCAHHLLPFNAHIAVGYIADNSVLGLSKFARIAHAAARRPTSQEELVSEIADLVSTIAGTPHVAVLASGRHLCLSMRGVRSPAVMTTSVTRGNFRDHPETRAEWLSLVGAGALRDADA